MRAVLFYAEESVYKSDIQERLENLYPRGHRLKSTAELAALGTECLVPQSSGGREFSSGIGSDCQEARIAIALS
jgi:hypothetical protein